uniref:Uncharacterized protein n=1 Tax=Amphimedon queenslandica TaxID=400682 RepID=A0A1X7V119_AMPQE
GSGCIGREVEREESEELFFLSLTPSAFPRTHMVVSILTIPLSSISLSSTG